MICDLSFASLLLLDLGLRTLGFGWAFLRDFWVAFDVAVLMLSIVFTFVAEILQTVRRRCSPLALTACICTLVRR
jgi:hypothetical protein